jgi:Arc/MetJ-type ribon-helix-helix transcriptional regulator
MIELKVSDARQRDVARGIGRIDENAMKKLRISAGDVIEVKGKRTTAVIAWPAHSEDQDKGMIRIDGFARKNAGVTISDLVVVRPAEAKDASHITLEPEEMRISPIDKDFVAFVKNRLMERVFVEEDTTFVMMLGHPVLLRVTKAIPDGIVSMAHGTELVVKGGPVNKGISEISKLSPRAFRKGFALGKRDNTVMTRLSDEDLKQIDMLVGIGLFDSRSEAVAYLTHEGIVAKREMFEELSSKFEQINKIRDEAKALLGTSAPISNLKECQKCGKENPPENKFCSSCGQELQ